MAGLGQRNRITFRGNSKNIFGLYRDNGTHWGNSRVMLGLYGDNGKYAGNYYLGFRVLVFRGY